ncbi:MAG: ArsR/SmtB family transcription factor [Nanoarchaeota archaeon]
MVNKYNNKMTKKDFLFLSLDDLKAKKIANVVNNESCQKILSFLTKNEGTETQIAKELDLPISTVHYNLKQLLDTNLIYWEKYHYSSKGKEVKHYAITNQCIVIAPKKNQESFMEKLKTIIPVSLLIFLTTFFIHYLTKSVGQFQKFDSNSQETLKMNSIEAVRNQSVNSSNLLLDFINNIIYLPSFWFLFGVFFMVLLVYLIKKFKL